MNNNYFKLLKIETFFVVSIFCLGLCWALVSPVSSSSDDDYHLTSIWCQKSDEDYCKRISTEAVLVPPKLNTGKIPERFTGLPPCYVTWPYLGQSAECLKDIGTEAAYSDRINNSFNSKIYYLFVSQFISNNVEQSVIKIRIINLIIFSLTLFALLISLKKSAIARVVLGLTFSLSPIALFFIVSTNPISWAITSISFSYIFLILTVTKYRAKKKLEMFPLLFVLFTFGLGVGARFDSLFYLAISYIGAFIVSYKKEIDLIAQKLKYVNKLIIRFVESILIFMLTKIILTTLHGNSIDINLEMEEKNSPNPILNILIEIPAFLVGLVGGQEPRFQQAWGELGRNFTYGAGWLEYNFLSITGIFLSFTIAILVFNQLRFITESKIALIILYSTSFISLIIIERAHWKYLDGAYFQPRYFSGLLCAFLISIFLVGEMKETKMSKAQYISLYFLWVFGQFLAWKTSYTRYTSGLEYPITAFQNPIEWRPYYLIAGFTYVSFFCHFLFASVSFRIISKQVFTKELDLVDVRKNQS